MDQIKSSIKCYLRDRLKDAWGFLEYRQGKEISIEDAARALALNHCKYGSFTCMGLQARPFGGIPSSTAAECEALWRDVAARVERNNSAVHWLRELARECAGASGPRKEELLQDFKPWALLTNSDTNSDTNPLPLAKAIAVAPSLLGSCGADADEATLLRESEELALAADRHHDEVTHMCCMGMHMRL